MNPTFHEKRRQGARLEHWLARWLQERGHTVIPTCDLPALGGVGPRILVPDGEAVAPDLLVISDGRPTWIECKAKTQPSWNRARGRWEHGIDLELGEAYLELEKATGVPVWVVVGERAHPGERYSPEPLVLGGRLLAARLPRLWKIGRVQDGWPRAGRRGLLWDRYQMAAWCDQGWRRF
jgi:hypothetical protein